MHVQMWRGNSEYSRSLRHYSLLFSSLELQPWFYKAMDRPEAEKLLRMVQTCAYYFHFHSDISDLRLLLVKSIVGNVECC